MPKKRKNLNPLPSELELIRLELEINDFPIPDGLALSREEVLAEIAYALKPEMHERKIPAYGCIICSGEFTYEGARRISTTASLSASFIRIAADGRRTFVVRASGREPELWEIEPTCDSELDLLNLARATHGLALKRIESGLVSLIRDNWAYTVRGREWLVRRPITQMADAVRQVAPGIYGVNSMLELCCYVLSPKNVGTIFVQFLKEPTTAEIKTWSDRADIRSLHLDTADASDYSKIVHLARHHDGAFLIGPDGLIRSIGAHLTYDVATAGLIGPQRGTRHTSAKRYSYEHASAIVFVVSEDGHVSVFSDGARVADSPILASHEVRFLRGVVPANRDAVYSALDILTCGHCHKDLAIQVVTVAGFKEHEEVACPICEKPGVYSAMCWSLTATPIKHL